MSSEGVKAWVRSVNSVKAKTADGRKITLPPADVEMITDMTASNGPDPDTADFTAATGGCMDRWRSHRPVEPHQGHARHGHQHRLCGWPRRSGVRSP